MSPTGPMTITFDPAVDEEQDVVRAVGQAYASSRRRAWSHSSTGAAFWPAGQTAGGWTASSMYRYVAALKPVARQVLLTILTLSPCPTADARESAALSACRYAEAHASLEEALLAVPQMTRLPFDVVDSCFVVDHEVAELVVAALDRIEQGGGAEAARASLREPAVAVGV